MKLAHRIEESAAKKQARVDSKQDIVVGMNKYRLATDASVDVLSIDNTAVRLSQIKRLEVRMPYLVSRSEMALQGYFAPNQKHTAMRTWGWAWSPCPSAAHHLACCSVPASSTELESRKVPALEHFRVCNACCSCASATGVIWYLLKETCCI